ncbi:hypothetical protein BGZ98_000927 [Dissophora globulifera]|nr:hypothetical protein BGZ98_000927 [Dissophora globulifera]
MHSINPLELPEITEIIAGYLSNLVPCLTVCKAWRSLYLPYYWREVTAGTQRHRSTDHTPLFELARYGHYGKFVRVLTVYNDVGLINQSLDYPNLRKLSLFFYGENLMSRQGEDPVLKDFVDRHQFLECLLLQNITSSVMGPTWTALVDHPRLDKLILECIDTIPDDFWRVCARLTALELRYFDTSAQICVPNDLAPLPIRRLKVEFEDPLDIIAACPLLEELVWTAGYSYNDPVLTTFGHLATRFGHLATKGTWPHLQQLSLNSHAKDADLSRVIASMHQVTKIEIHSGSFGKLSFAALQRHVGTLRYLCFPRATKSWIIRDVLCTCTRLEHLEGPRLYAKEIDEGGPWVCASLKSLSVNISFEFEETSLQPKIFERISRLVRLEELNSWNNLYPDEYAHGLIFRLRWGMASLASLSRLRVLVLHSGPQEMDPDDALWIMDHWKRLEIIQGDFVNRHPLLECLDLHDIPPATTDSAWTALVHHPRLEKVILGRSRSYPDDFWKVCTRLRTLEIANFNDATQKCIPKTLALPSIRRLKLVAQYNLNVQDELDIIAACPLLEELVWMAGYYHKNPVRAMFGTLATQGTWPYLRQLSINFDTEDADLAQVIASMHQATKIEIFSGSFGPLCFAALQHHAATLQHLHTPITDSRMTRDILCTFPRLEYLKGPLLNAKDIVEGGPWACTSLKYISVKISFNNEDDDLEPVVFERMSRLVHLEEFDNRFYYPPGATPEHGLRFRLQSGMAALANLSRLRIVRLDPNIQAMDLDDVRWIIDHWKRLETIRGNLSQDKSMAEQLEALISTSGIELQSDS